MAYQATVIPVMIASPGDVFEEREITRDVIHSWNYVNSLRTGVVLIPAGWETHSSPELGSRAQELINDRVLHKCDLLIGVFWTRLGSPTGDSESGTVEEIREHVAAGKPAMIYFSSKPVAPQSLDPEQYEALTGFKEECKSQGLIQEFDDLLQFRDLLTRQLQLCINDNDYLRELMPRDSLASQTPQAPTLPGGDLSAEAHLLVTAAYQDPHGRILKIATFGGRFVQAGGRTFGSEGGRESARWESALNELVVRALVGARGAKGEVFELTDQGWLLAERLALTSDL